MKSHRYFSLLIVMTICLMSSGCEKTHVKPDAASPKLETPILTIDTGGHNSLVRSVIFTDDSKYLISASEDKTIRVWDLKTGETVRILRGQIGEEKEGKIFAAALSPDNRWLASGGWMKGSDGRHKIRVFDFHTGEVVCLLKGHGNVISGLAFSPDSRRLISGSLDSTARIWDIGTARSIYELTGHQEAVCAVAFSPDGELAATGSYDKTLRLWNAQNAELITEMPGHENKVRTAAFTPDGKYLLSGSYDKTIRLWDGKRGGFIKVLASQNGTVVSLSVTPDSKYVLTGYGKGNHIFSIPGGEKQLSSDLHKNIVAVTAISPDGQLAATAGRDDHEICLWDIHNGNVKQKLAGKGTKIQNVGFGKDGCSVSWGKASEQKEVSGYGKRFYLKGAGQQGFRLSMGELLKNDDSDIRGAESVGNISIRTPNGKIHPTLQILKDEQVIHEITRETFDGNFHRSFSLTPDGKMAVSGGAVGVISAYDTQTGEEVIDFAGHIGDITSIAVSSDGSRLVSGSRDQTVKVWDMATGKNLLTIFPASDGEWVAWIPEGYYDCSANGEKYIGWHVNRGEDKAALYYPASEFADKFRKPPIVAKYLQTNGNIEEAIRLADTEDPKRDKQ